MIIEYKGNIKFGDVCVFVFIKTECIFKYLYNPSKNLKFVLLNLIYPIHMKKFHCFVSLIYYNIYKDKI